MISSTIKLRSQGAPFGTLQCLQEAELCDPLVLRNYRRTSWETGAGRRELGVSSSGPQMETTAAASAAGGFLAGAKSSSFSVDGLTRLVHHDSVVCGVTGTRTHLLDEAVVVSGVTSEWMRLINEGFQCHVCASTLLDAR